MLISFEGIDGSGKSTLIGGLSSSLTERGYRVITTKSPGTPKEELCQQIREMLLNPESEINNPYTELFLYLADQAQHFHSMKDYIVAPASELIVLCDRFTDSTIAYQGFGRCLDIGFIADATQQSIGYKPDLTVLLDIDPTLALRRLDRTKDRLESMDLDFYERVRDGYKAMSSLGSKGRWFVVNAEKDVYDVFQAVLDKVLSVIDGRN